MAETAWEHHQRPQQAGCMYPNCVPDHARQCQTVPDGARRCQAVPGSARESRQADAFRCISMHMPRWAPAATHLVRMSFPHGSRQDRGTQRATGLPKPEGPESRMGAFYPGTLAYPHVSASSAFLPAPLHRSHEATARG